MEYKIEILDYVDDPRGMKKGFVDIKIIYAKDKEKIFRGLAYFEKENKKWLSLPCIKRGEKWLPYYNLPSNILALALEAFEEYLKHDPIKLTSTLASEGSDDLCPL